MNRGSPHGGGGGGGGRGNHSFWSTTDRDLDRKSWRRDPQATPPAPHGSSSPYSDHHSAPNPGEHGPNQRRSHPPPRGGAPGDDQQPHHHHHHHHHHHQQQQQQQQQQHFRAFRDYRPNRHGPGGRGREYSRGRGYGRGRGPGRGEVSGQVAEANGYGASGSPAGTSGRGAGGGDERNSFDAAEALNVFRMRWDVVSRELKDSGMPAERKPIVYKVEGAWGNSKLPLQASVPDFLSELKKALTRSDAAAGNGEAK